MGLSSPGIGSNLDINGIVTQLMTVESQPLTTLAKKEASYQAKLSAFGSVKGALSAFQAALGSLRKPDTFKALSASSGDTTIINGSAASDAVPGTYDINVTALAQNQTLASTGQTSTTSTIGSGSTTTLTFQFGTIGGGTIPTGGIYPVGTTFTQDATHATGTVTIDNTNNSLQGIRDAINKAGIGVTASIVSDGSATPNRLVLSSASGGAASSMKITVSGDGTLQGLLAYDPSSAGGQNMSETATAHNTALTVNGIAVTSTTKNISEAIQGVSLTAAKIGSTTFSVTRDTATVTSAINDFVKAFNDTNKTLTNLTAYNPTTKAAGPLIGDASIRSIQTELRQIINTPIPELSGAITRLTDAGISFQKDGSMAVDSAKLQKAIDNNLQGVAALFAPYASSSDSLISYVDSTSSTKAGDYAVDLTAVATQGTVTGTVDLNAGSTTINADTTMNVTVDGITAAVSLVAGTYTGSGLATMLQSAINGTSEFATLGSAVAATIDGNGHLNVASSRYGSASNITISSSSGTAVATILGDTPAAKVGVDVAGTIGGMDASGSGKYLTGGTGSSASGLKLLVAGGSIGARGAIDFSRGYADKLNDLLDTFLGSSGMISNRTKGINSSIKEISNSRDALNTRLAATEKRYRAQFLALDTVISSMKKTSDFLTQQLANLPKIE